MSLSKQEFTNGGRDMLTQAQGGHTLHISKIVVGSGVASVPGDLWPLTALIVHEMDVTISSIRNIGGGVLMVEGNFRSTDAPHPFFEREVGIMAHIDSGTDALYSVANVFADPPNYIDPAAPTIRAYKIKLIVDRVDPSDITVTISPSDAVSGESLGVETDGPGVYQSTAGNILKFKRLVAGDGIEITQDNDDDTLATEITIGAKVLHNNLDLYVPETYPGISDPNILFHTIQDAHDYLKQFHIPSDKTATIHVYSGHWTQTAPIVFSHPDSTQIILVGLAPVIKTVSGTVTRGGSLPNVDVTVPIPSGTTGIAVGDVAYLYDAPHWQMEGCGVVNQVLSTSVRLRMIILNLLPPSSIAALGSTKLITYPTQFARGIVADGPMFSFPHGIGAMKNFGIKSNTFQFGMGISVNGAGILEHISAAQFQYGIGLNNGTTLLNPVVAANGCGAGLSTGPLGAGSVGAPNPVGGWARHSFNGSTYGIWTVGGSYTTGFDGTATYCCGNSTGIRADTRSWVGIASATHSAGIVAASNGVGLHATSVSIINTSIAVESGVNLNTTWDIQADSGGQVGLVYNSTMSGLYSPALDTLGPSGGYIHIGALNPP